MKMFFRSSKKGYLGNRLISFLFFDDCFFSPRRCCGTGILNYDF